MLPLYYLGLSKRDHKWLNAALRLAETSEANQRHGAIIVRGGSVLGMGVNKRKNNPLIIEKDHKTSCGDHAEVAAIKRTGKTQGATIYIARMGRSGNPINSKPCTNCAEALDKAGIKKVVYTV